MPPEANAHLQIDALGSMNAALTDDKEQIDSPSTYSEKAPSIGASTEPQILPRPALTLALPLAGLHELEESYPQRSALPSAAPSVSDFFDPNLDVEASWFGE